MLDPWSAPSKVQGATITLPQALSIDLLSKGPAEVPQSKKAASTPQADDLAACQPHDETIARGQGRPLLGEAPRGFNHRRE